MKKKPNQVMLTVVGKRCVYINNYRVAGNKPYVSENLPEHSFVVDPAEILHALGFDAATIEKKLIVALPSIEGSAK